MTRLRRAIVPITIVFVANLLIWLAPWALAQAAGAVLLLILAPGWSMARMLLGKAESPEAHLRTLLSGFAAGFGVASVVVLLLAYLPGGIARMTALIVFNLVAIAAIAALILVNEQDASRQSTESSPLPRTFWIALVVILALAGTLRFASLGYSEFQGDEARVLLRAQDLLAGFENPVFIHHKTPGEILVTAGVLGASDLTNEAAARLPFALAGLAAVAATLLLGWRLFGGVAGIAAASLLAVDGYAVAFARIVQYQSIVILASVMILLLLWHLLERTKQNATGYWREFMLLALIGLGGLYAHYDVLAIALPVCWLLWRLAQQLGWGSLLRNLLPALVVMATGAALFFVPWVRNPGFGMALDYVVGERLGTRPPYDNLLDFARRTSAYSSIYLLMLLGATTIAGAIALYARQFGRRIVVIASLLGVILAAAALAFRPDIAALYVGIALAGLLVAVPLLPRLTVAERTVWLWFAPLLFLTLFFVQKPDTHVYIFFLPWFLVVGATLQAAWKWAEARDGRAWRVVFAASGIVILALLWGWQWLIFADAPAERYRQWTTSIPALYWYPFDAPPERANMGFPLRNGWKSVGVLYDEGAIDGGFESNAKPEVVDWYTRGAGACPAMPVRFLLAETVESVDDAQLAEVRDGLEAGRTREGAVTVRGVDRLLSFADGAQDSWRAADEEIEADFARLAIQPPISRRGRVLDLPAHTAVDARVGDGFLLRGFSGEGDSLATVQRGETVPITLYWESKAIVPDAYTVFLQLVDTSTNTKAAQTDALPVCGQNPTNLWRPGDLIADPQRIEIFPDAPPGEYTLFAGMYDVATGARLPIVAADGTVSDWIALLSINVES